MSPFPEWQVDNLSCTADHVHSFLRQMPHPLGLIILLEAEYNQISSQLLSRLYNHLSPTFGDVFRNVTDEKLHYQLTTERERSVVELRPSEFAEADALAQRLLKNGAKSVTRIYITSEQTPNPTPPQGCRIIVHC